MRIIFRFSDGKRQLCTCCSGSEMAEEQANFWYVEEWYVPNIGKIPKKCGCVQFRVASRITRCQVIFSSTFLVKKYTTATRTGCVITFFLFSFWLLISNQSEVFLDVFNYELNHFMSRNVGFVWEEEDYAISSL